MIRLNSLLYSINSPEAVGMPMNFSLVTRQ